MTNARMTLKQFTRETTTGQCEGCWEHTAASGDLVTCDNCDQPTTVRGVSAQLTVEGVDYGTREFFGDDAMAQADAYAAPIMAALKGA